MLLLRVALLPPVSVAAAALPPSLCAMHIRMHARWSAYWRAQPNGRGRRGEDPMELLLLLLPAALPDGSLRVAAFARPPSAAATPRLDQHRRHLLHHRRRRRAPLLHQAGQEVRHVQPGRVHGGPRRRRRRRRTRRAGRARLAIRCVLSVVRSSNRINSPPSLITLLPIFERSILAKVGRAFDPRLSATRRLRPSRPARKRGLFFARSAATFY